MGISIENTQFQQFVKFALGAKSESDFAEVSDKMSLGNYTIHAKKMFDFVGNIGRGDESMIINETARTLFREAVAALFGDESRIPKSVLDAMKTNDYGQGKPLSARRILAVNNAIAALNVQPVQSTPDNCIGDSLLPPQPQPRPNPPRQKPVVPPPKPLSIKSPLIQPVPPQLDGEALGSILEAVGASLGEVPTFVYAIQRFSAAQKEVVLSLLQSETPKYAIAYLRDQTRPIASKQFDPALLSQRLKDEGVSNAKADEIAQKVQNSKHRNRINAELHSGEPLLQLKTMSLLKDGYVRVGVMGDGNCFYYTMLANMGQAPTLAAQKQLRELLDEYVKVNYPVLMQKDPNMALRLQEADAMQKSGGIKKNYEYADLALVPFMASLTNRPITVYTVHRGQVNKSFYTKDILTGKPLTGEPMAVIYNQDGKHFEATERLAD